MPLAMCPKGPRAFAQDYQELVTVIAVERKPNPEREDLGTYTVLRRNGEETTNYPGYLLTWVDKTYKPCPSCGGPDVVFPA